MKDLKSVIWLHLALLNIAHARFPKSILHVRGGSTTTATPNADNDVQWRLEQHQLLQLRSTFLSEALVSRGIPLKSMLEVSTLDGERPPQVVDWDCVLSTEEDPKSCLYSFDAQAYTKVVAPVGTTEYISLTALNRLRRTDPSKVEPMWHSKYAILRSWFGDASAYSFSQHLGGWGFLVSTVLLDWNLLRAVIYVGLWAFLTTVGLPALTHVVNRLLCSTSILWRFHGHWGRLVHAAFPFKLLVMQQAWKYAAGRLDALESVIRDIVVEWECDIMERHVPLTVEPVTRNHPTHTGDTNNENEVINDEEDEEDLTDFDEE